MLLAIEHLINGIDDDTNGYVDDWQGWDYLFPMALLYPLSYSLFNQPYRTKNYIEIRERELLEHLGYGKKEEFRDTWLTADNAGINSFIKL